MLPSIVNINFAVLNVPRVGGSSTKAVLTADNKFDPFAPKMEKNLITMISPKNLLRTMMNSNQGAHNVGRTLTRKKIEKYVAYAAVISFTKDVRCFHRGIGNVTTA